MAYVRTPEEDEFLHRVKCDLNYFKQALGLRSDRSSEMHAQCPYCGDQTGFQFGQSKTRLGEMFYHCHSCGQNGDVFTALNLMGRMSMRDVFKKVRADFGGKTPQSQHDAYHQQRQQEIQRNKGATLPTPLTPPPPAAYVNGTSHGTAHGHGAVPAFTNTQPVFPPRPIPPPQRQTAPTQYSQPNGRGYALPQPSFTENQQPIVHLPKLVEPVLNLDMANQFIEIYHKYLLDNFHLMKKWQRGISREVAEKYKLGFGEHFPVKFRPWNKPVIIPAAWVLPITNEKGELKGVKIHCEESYTRYDGKPGEKCFWMPFGTQPAWQREDKEKNLAEVKPEHKYVTLWPHPDTLQQKTANDFSLEASWWIERIPEKLRGKFQNKVEEHRIMMAYEKAVDEHLLDSPAIWECQLRAFDALKKEIMDAVMKVDDVFKKTEDAVAVDKPRTDWSKFIFVCPGELKALAWESCGYMATGSTGGESWGGTPELLRKFAGQAVCLPCDEDPPKRVFKKQNGEIVRNVDGVPETARIVCAGKAWGAKWGQSLGMYGAEKVCVRYCGQKVKDEEEF